MRFPQIREELHHELKHTVRIDAPSGWDFRPLCNLYLDVTGGCENRCSFQLPYSEERGHHICPEANVLLLLLDQSAVIEEGVFVLLLGVINPAAAPSQNLWKISLINSAAASGDSGSDKVTTLLIPGFFVGFRQSLQLPAVPLTDEVFQALTSESRQPPWILAAAAGVASACCRGRMLSFLSPIKDSSQLAKLKAERDRLEEVFSTQQVASKAAEAALATASEEQKRWCQRVLELQKLHAEQAGR
eukprot:s685_g6.t1